MLSKEENLQMEVCVGNTPTTDLRPGREVRLKLPLKIPTPESYFKTINIVVHNNYSAQMKLCIGEMNCYIYIVAKIHSE